MKVLKMHNDADGQFDQFLKSQLEQIEVDPALAQHYFDQMILPPATPGSESVAAAAKSGWWRFWIGAAVAGTIAVIVYQTTRPGPANQPASSQVQALATDSVKRQDTLAQLKVALASPAPPASLASPAASPPSPPAPSPPPTTPPTQPPVAATPPATNDSLNRPTPANEVPLTMPETKKKDSLPKQLRPAVIPKKNNDSLYIIW